MEQKQAPRLERKRDKMGILKETPEQGCCRCKHTPRSEEMLRQLRNRLSRMIGQMNGLQRMLEENRYCGDILTQVGAIERGLQSFGYCVLQDHLHSCVSEQVRQGNEAILDEVVELVKQLK